MHSGTDMTLTWALWNLQPVAPHHSHKAQQCDYAVYNKSSQLCSHATQHSHQQVILSQHSRLTHWHFAFSTHQPVSFSQQHTTFAGQPWIIRLPLSITHQDSYHAWYLIVYNQSSIRVPLGSNTGRSHISHLQQAWQVSELLDLACKHEFEKFDYKTSNGVYIDFKYLGESTGSKYGYRWING